MGFDREAIGPVSGGALRDKKYVFKRPESPRTPASAAIVPASAVSALENRVSTAPTTTPPGTLSIDVPEKGWEENYKEAKDLLKHRKYDSALAIYEIVIKQHPTADTLNYYGAALAQSLRKQEAETFFLKACEQFPTDPELHRNLGRVYERNHKLDPAIKEYETAFSLGLDDPDLEAHLKTVKSSGQDAPTTKP